LFFDAFISKLRKLNNSLDFTNRETAKIIEVLDIKGDEIKEYFFTERVAQTATE